MGQAPPATTTNSETRRNNIMHEDADEIYEALRHTAERYGWVGWAADDKLSEAARAMADDPQNADEE